MSSTTRKILLVLAALVLGLLIGRWSAGIFAGPGAVIAMDADEMELAMEEALAIPSTHERLARLVDLSRRFDAENVRGAGLALRGKVSSADENDVRLVVGAWAALDPRAALDSVMTWPLESKRKIGASVAAYEWGRLGGGLEAREYVTGVEQRDVQGYAVRGLVRGWAQSGDLDGLTAFVSSRERISARETLTEQLVNSLLATGGVEAVMAWADSVPIDAQNNYKRIAYKKALRQVSNRDPEAGVRWYEGQQGEPHAVRSLGPLAGEWAEHDPLAALDWLLAQPPGGERQIALQRWITRWTSHDFEAALAWMESADLSGPLAGLPAPFVGALLPYHPVEASDWVDRIADEGKRAKAIRALVQAWLPRDRRAAQAWLATRSESATLLEATGVQRPQRRRIRSDSQEGGQAEEGPSQGGESPEGGGESS